MSEKSTIITVRVTKSFSNTLNKFVDDYSINRSEFIRKAIEEVLNKYNNKFEEITNERRNKK